MTEPDALLDAIRGHAAPSPGQIVRRPDPALPRVLGLFFVAVAILAFASLRIVPMLPVREAVVLLVFALVGAFFAMRRTQTAHYLRAHGRHAWGIGAEWFVYVPPVGEPLAARLSSLSVALGARGVPVVRVNADGNALVYALEGFGAWSLFLSQPGSGRELVREIQGRLRTKVGGAAH